MEKANIFIALFKKKTYICIYTDRFKTFLFKCEV